MAKKSNGKTCPECDKPVTVKNHGHGEFHWCDNCKKVVTPVEKKDDQDE